MLGVPRRLLAAAIIVAAVALPDPASAATGDLDPSFAGDGDLGIFGTTYEMEPAPGGGFVLALGEFSAGVGRFDRRGRPVRTFGSKGFATIPGPDWATNSIDRAVDVERHRNGWLAVLEEGEGGRAESWLARLTPAGTIDSRFGRGGYVRIGERAAQVSAVGVDAEDRILAVVVTAAGRTNHIAQLRRYLPDGTLDRSFGKRGSVRLGSARSIAASNMTITPSGSVLLTLHRSDGSVSRTDIRLYGRKGVPIPSFGDDGRASVRVPGSATTYLGGVHRLDDGRIIVTGTAVSADERQHLFAMRLTATGRIDTSYGTNGVGIVSDPIWSLQQGSGTVDATGRVYLAGITFNQSVVARLTASGHLDTTFGGASSVRTPLPGWVRHWVVQSDALVLGTYYPFSAPYLRIVRMEL